MKFSQLFIQTFKEVPADAQVPSHQLLHRGGFIQKAGMGLYHYSPLMLRVIAKTERIIRDELAKVGCLEIVMSMATPAELWKESDRWEELGELMVQFKDRGGRELCLSPTNEEAVVDYFRKIAKSYKQLPVCLYQINTKFRDEIRPRFGLMRAREFVMKDAYSFHIDKACLDREYERMHDAYTAIFERMGVHAIAVEADAGAMAEAGAKTHEFQVLADTGEDALVVCDAEQTAQNSEMAVTKRSSISTVPCTAEHELIQTPGVKTIEAVTAHFDVPASQTLKSMLFKGKKSDKTVFVMACCLGDDEINDRKLASHTGLLQLELLTPEESVALGFIPGAVGPVHIPCMECLLIVDAHVDLDAAYIVGANQKAAHFKSVKLSRDCSNFTVNDIRLAKPSDVSQNDNPLRFCRGIEVGHIFQLGDKYTKALKADVLNQNGKAIFPLMGCYGIGVGRAIAASVEQHHDENGIVWPLSIAPFQILIIPLLIKDEAVVQAAEQFYQECLNAGIDAAIDDRLCSPGVKFKDADLIGIPHQVIFGKTVKEAQEVEWVQRKTTEKKQLSIQECFNMLSKTLS